jgi:tetratricopeptide (TPR) repeat protein
MARSKTVTAAWISAGAVVLVGVIAGVFLLIKPQTPGITITTAHEGDSPIIVTGESSDIKIEYNIPESRTHEAIAALEEKLQETGQELQLQRSDIELLTEALRDLDQRTSGIERLPDGRTKIGDLVTGQPVALLEEHDAAIAAYTQGKYEEALGHSKAAIAMLEASRRTDVSMSTGSLPPVDESKIFYVAGLSAQRLHQTGQALEWAQKAVELSRSAETLGLLVSALANAGRRAEATTTLSEALASFPDAPALLHVRSQLVPSAGQD